MKERKIKMQKIENLKCEREEGKKLKMKCERKKMNGRWQGEKRRGRGAEEM